MAWAGSSSNMGERSCLFNATTYWLMDNLTLWDWAPAAHPECPECREKIPPILALGESSTVQTEIWKLFAAFGSGSLLYPQQSSGQSKYGDVGHSVRYPQACVPYPFMLLVGIINVTLEDKIYKIECMNCTLTNCIRGIDIGNGIVVIKQPAFVMIPVNISETWYEESGLELWNKVRGALARPRRGIGLIVLGIVSLITLIATAVTASVSLAQSVHTASIVENLAKNTSIALGIQEDIDKKVEDRLNALYDTVRFLGEEVQGLKLRNKIRCHANYRWICVTPKIYNQNETSWDKVKHHLEGIWHNENISLDLVRLHQEILDIENAPKATMDITKDAEDFVNSLFSHFPSVTGIWHALIGLASILVILLIIMCLLPCLFRRLLADLFKIKAILHGYHLQQKRPVCACKNKKGGDAGSGALPHLP
ncbi:hypothetical protein FD754_025408 [Muntiacus muntjak]|uniref:Retroviral envelope protein GP41-like domain-containing protein n=1 Tax=Muntiacus muntjak TaxID=9888 RepID=A0A5N3UJ43_MUNMU|nr:hypothetical protein FD754_025409 [Muntiacus muntjak]KAB0337019.1 hypothetical protein FD754_025408 [Muntiacus muntjak]